MAGWGTWLVSVVRFTSPLLLLLYYYYYNSIVELTLQISVYYVGSK